MPEYSVFPIKIFSSQGFFYSAHFLIKVEHVSLKSILAGKWLTRMVLISSIICAASVFVVLKNIEFVVHGQLYYYGLIFSTEWADAYRVLTWMIFICAGVPLALSTIALASSFLNFEEIPGRKRIVPQKERLALGITNVGFKQTCQTQQTQQVQQDNRESVTRVDIGNCIGISCPECKKVFGKALVMLDFRSGSNRMISVCPYCNHVLGYTKDEKSRDNGFRVASLDKKIKQ